MTEQWAVASEKLAVSAERYFSSRWDAANRWLSLELEHFGYAYRISALPIPGPYPDSTRHTALGLASRHSRVLCQTMTDGEWEMHVLLGDCPGSWPIGRVREWLYDMGIDPAIDPVQDDESRRAFDSTPDT